MARVDQYLSSLSKLGADALVMRSGQGILLKFATGDRSDKRPMAHEIVCSMVNEVAPKGAKDQLGGGSDAQFSYQADGRIFWFSVNVKGSEWTVTVEPIPGEEDAAEAPLELAQATPLPIPLAEPAPRPRVPTAAPKPTISEPVASGARYIDALLRKMTEFGGSDLHLSAGCRPYMRVNGDLLELQGTESMAPDWLRNEILALAPEENRAEFNEKNDTDFGYQLHGVSRFRVNLFADRRGPGAVIRVIPFKIPRAEDLGLSGEVLNLCELTKGLVLVTGPTGSGKSTTLASLVDRVNETRHDHIITIEDPIEFVHENKKCLVNQREIKTHTRGFHSALRAALREDPDIVLVGELRDLETIAIAIETAETGHLVFGTLHTSTAPSTLDRLIDQFPPDRQEQIRQMLAKSLRGVIAQVLCRKRGGGRVAAHEILLANSAVENLIRERKTFQLFSLMQTSRNQGMRRMQDSLIDLVKGGLIEPDEAYRKAIDKLEFRKALHAEGFPL